MVATMQDTADLQSLFGLSGDDELMESFQCSLAQTYKCLHNTFSEPREVCTRALSPDACSGFRDQGFKCSLA